MTLANACEQYGAFRKNLGERFETTGRQLRAFCRFIGPDTTIADVSSDKVNVFLAGKGPLTASWHVRYNALRGFYRYSVSRGLVAAPPLPNVIPKRPPAFQPYIYSQAELKRLLSSIESCRRRRSDIGSPLLRCLFLLMYGAALRISEVLSLTVGDVDLANRVLTIRDSKFFKTRLVPIGPNTGQILGEYAKRRADLVPSTRPDVAFFLDRNAKPVPIHKLERAFQQIREHAGLHREGGPRCQPRLHDLRHTSAVHRLTTWYREGEDVQKFLPQLSVYLGHTHLAATQVYLTMTPELLHEASVRFERYAIGGGWNE